MNRLRLLPLLLLAACATLDPLTPERGTPAPRALDPLPEELSLEEAVSRALSSNPDLRVQSFGPLIAGTFLEQEEARFSPAVFAEASRRESRSSETARATGEQFNAEVEQTRLIGGLRQEFAAGTRVELSAQQISESSNRAPDQEEARLSLSVTQALLQGRGQERNLIGVEKARLDVDISRAELSGFLERLVADVETAYWNLWLAEQTITITEQALEVAEKQLSDLRDRIEVGQLARNEEAVALAEVSRRRQNVVDARANLRQRRIELLRQIAPGLNDESFRAAAPPTLPELDPADTLELRRDLALRSRADLAEARLRLEQRRLDTVLTRDGLLPRLDFFANLAKTGFGADTGDAWSDLGGDGYDVQAGLRFSRGIGSRPEDHRDAEARFRRDQAEAAVRNLEFRAETELRLALNELARATEQVRLSAETRQFQELTAAAEVERFEAGSGTALMVAQAQRDLLSALIEEQRARVTARLALLRLYRAEGTLLDRRAIGH